MLDFLEKHGIAFYFSILSFLGGALIGHDASMMKLDKYQSQAERYIDSIKTECNLKIAQANNLK